MSIRKQINRLAEVKANFGPDPMLEKGLLLELLAVVEITDPRLLYSYHESLCYLRAFADSPRILELVRSELYSFERRVRTCRRLGGKHAREFLDDTGIVGTTLNHNYGYYMTKWLRDQFPGATDIDWKVYRNSGNDPIIDLLPVLVDWAENDAIDDPYLPLETIIKADIGKREVNVLEWFARVFERLPAQPSVKRVLYDNFELPVKIKVGRHRFARTLIETECDDYHFQVEPLRKVYPNLLAEAKRRDLKPNRLTLADAAKIIDLTKCVLVMRHRELWPLTFANPLDVWATPIGRGTTIYIIGMQPAWRLPIEADYAALIVRNGIPIGYGIGAMALERIEIAINIFESFRSSEAAFIFGKFAQIFHQLFGSTYLVIRRYQVGYNNDEGLESGAYWFYYKLGFRSIDGALRQLAEAEAEKIRADRSYRTPLAILKQLAESDLCLNLKSPTDFSQRDLSLGNVALAQTKLVSAEFDGDRDRAKSVLEQRARQSLGLRSIGNWTRDEQIWFKRWAPLVCVLPGASSWNPVERRSLIALIRAKAAAQEQNFVHQMIAHRKLNAALRKLSGSA